MELDTWLMWRGLVGDTHPIRKYNCSHHFISREQTSKILSSLRPFFIPAWLLTKNLMWRVLKLKKKFVWGITGSGDEIEKILDYMSHFKESHPDIDIRVYLSKSAEQVLTWYKLLDSIKTSYKVKTETSPNTPFLAGEVQSGKYDFMLVAPTTSNSTTKIALGIGDTLITNAVNMAVKANVPVYLFPCEAGEEEKVTILPNGEELRLTIREIDAKYIEMLEKDPGIHVLRNINEIKQTLHKYYS